MTATEPSFLPQWKGRPVPWVARWSGQVLRARYELARGSNGGTPFFTYLSAHEDRDEHGVLWLQEAIERSGEPQWAMVSTLRQRASMRRRLCQVCGEKITTETTPWLVDEAEWEAIQSAQAVKAPLITVTAPVCENCIDLATSLCPQLVKGFHLLDVKAFHIWGISGETLLNGKIRPFQIIGYDEKPRLRVTLARQQLIELDDWEEVERWESSTAKS